MRPTGSVVVFWFLSPLVFGKTNFVGPAVRLGTRLKADDSFGRNFSTKVSLLVEALKMIHFAPSSKESFHESSRYVQ